MNRTVRVTSAMKIQVIGASGGWPAQGQACSGYLIEHEGFRLLLDAGYGVATALSSQLEPGDIQAVFLSHGHPDHTADLHPLLRGRILSGETDPLPVYAAEGVIDPVVSWEGLGELDGSFSSVVVGDGDEFEVGPFRATTLDLPHLVPNLGIRLSVGGRAFAYTGDAGPSAKLATISKGADLLIAEATFARDMPARLQGNLSTAVDAARSAASAGVDRLWLTHLWPGSDPQAHADEVREHYQGQVDVAASGMTLELD